MPLIIIIAAAVVLGHLIIALLPWLAGAAALYAVVRLCIWLYRRRTAARTADAQRARAVLIRSGQVRRVQKCMALLGSPHDGERLAALAALDRILATEGITYTQLARALDHNLSIR